ncbi:MAG: glycosyltransferase family 4 protein [Candidatus Aenigmarchaeota archaeon]|nr:glycosyltransferase family 4 protein [Candidatus Aenigmarchaeota archaeon]
MKKNVRNKGKMKVLYLGNFSDPSYEGLMTIVGNLKSNLKNEVYENDKSKIGEADLISIHSSGFFESIGFSGMKGLKIYSLHANIVPLYFARLLDYIQWLLFVYSRKNDYLSMTHRIVKIMANLISNFTPLFVKRFFLNEMDAVIVPSKWLSGKLRLRNSYIIRQGIDVRKFKSTGKGNGSKIVMSFFGHPDSEKGIFELIDSFSKLQDSNIEKNMFFTEKTEKIENFISRKDKSVKVFGFVEDIVKEYNDSDIVILPYRHSLGGIATPLVLLEAMACGRAIITTDLPHLREICGDAVFYVKPYSVEDLLNAIRYLGGNPELRKMLGKKARERAVKYYDQKKMFLEYEKLFEKLSLSHDNKQMPPKP